MRKLGIGLLTILCVGVALYAAHYWLPIDIIPGAGGLVNNMGASWLALHAGTGSLALVLGPFQFSNLFRQRAPALHRSAGVIYILACLISGIAGLLLAAGSVFGPVAQAGFAGLGLLWIAFVILGWRSALQRRFAHHRRWMWRSYALTFAAVTLRLQLAILPLTGAEFETFYPIIAWTCWVPNLIATEFHLRARRETISTDGASAG
ncbi:DUF2306 domain-containing protein [Hyphobacterium sp.]|uniref:DUF2306 domain-containing protein n=1 Tax=Hyphobacterium sp. TaxID=2004662 RepID=UPI003BA945E7